MSSLKLTWQVTGNQWSANVWEKTSMTLAETFRTDVRETAEEPWGQTGEDYSNQRKNIWDTDRNLFWEFPLHSLRDKSKVRWTVRCYVSSKSPTAPGLTFFLQCIVIVPWVSNREHHARLYLPYSLISFICVVINWSVIQDINILNTLPLI